MRKAKQAVKIVVKWNEGASAAGEPDPELVRELARELGRMAARHDIAMARKRAAEALQKAASDLGSKPGDVVG